MAGVEDKISHFINATCALLTNARMVDQYFLINPVSSTSRALPWKNAGDFPINMTAISSHISISNNFRVFENQQNGGPAKNAYTNTTVYFDLAISRNISPLDIIARVGIEWPRLGGAWLMVKTLACFDSIMP
jgi:hypothetical protein